MPKTLKCSACKRRRTLRHCTINKSRSTGRNHSCRECHRIYTRRHYAENKRYYVDKAKRITAAQRERMRKIVNEVKSAPCVDCGRRYHPVAMDLDHVRGRKVTELSRMCGGGWSERRIMAELKKCEVRCAVCHRLRTHGILQAGGTGGGPTKPAGEGSTPSLEAAGE